VHSSGGAWALRSVVPAAAQSSSTAERGGGGVLGLLAAHGWMGEGGGPRFLFVGRRSALVCAPGVGRPASSLPEISASVARGRETGLTAGPGLSVDASARGERGKRWQVGLRVGASGGTWVQACWASGAERAWGEGGAGRCAARVERRRIEGAREQARLGHVLGREEGNWTSGEGRAGPAWKKSGLG
jgi:hypothetical protein